jgi:hypothetical protein
LHLSHSGLVVLDKVLVGLCWSNLGLVGVAGLRHDIHTMQHY